MVMKTALRLVLASALTLLLTVTWCAAQPQDTIPQAPKPIKAVPVQLLNKGTKLHVRAMAFSPNGKTLYIAGTMGPPIGGNGPVDGRLGSWDVASGKLVREHKGPRLGYFCDGLFDGKYLLRQSETGRQLILVDPVTGQEVRRTEENDSQLHSVGCAWAGEKEVVAVTQDAQGRRYFRRWSLETGKNLPTPAALADSLPLGDWAVCSPDNNWYALTGCPGIRVRAAHTGKEVLYNPNGHRPTFAPDGKTFAYVDGDDSRVRLHRTDTWELLAELPWPGDPPPDAPRSRGVHALHFTADGRALVIAYNASHVAVVEVATGQFRYRFEHHTYSLRVFPENPLLVTVAQSRGGLRPDGPTRPSGWVALWDLHNPTSRQAAGLTRAEAARCLKQLDDTRAVVASEGMRALAANPNQAIGLLRQSLHAALKPDPQQVARWIIDLDSDDFDTREKAEQRLREQGAAIRSLLTVARGQPHSPDVAMRLRILVDELNDPARPARLRVVRSVELLEYFATPEARAVLADLAGGAPGAVATEEARAALRRLDR